MVAETLPPRLAQRLIQGGKLLCPDVWVVENGLKVQRTENKYVLVGPPDKVLHVMLRK